jgi:hypothetical protein
VKRFAWVGLVAGMVLPAAAAAQSGSTTIGGQWFLNYQAGKSGGRNFNRFGIDRGYINIRHTLNERWSGRITPDVTVDGSGDAKVRLKYAYADLELPDAGVLTSPHIEFGMVHRPWLDYEEHLNEYRSQGTMFLERNGLFNSADFGVTFFALLGGRVDETYQPEVSSAYPGRWGSFAVGLYNGGGYHAVENNENKSLEGRLSLRPLPDALPGLQLTYLGIIGDGNTPAGPAWRVNTLFASLEGRAYVLTAQAYRGAGNSRGNALDGSGASLDQDGWSLFGEWKLHGPGMSLIGRYDRFNAGPDADDDKSERVIGGLAWHIQGSSMILFDYDVESRDGFDTAAYRVFKFSIEYSF